MPSTGCSDHGAAVVVHRRERPGLVDDRDPRRKRARPRRRARRRSGRAPLTWSAARRATAAYEREGDRDPKAAARACGEAAKAARRQPRARARALPRVAGSDSGVGCSWSITYTIRRAARVGIARQTVTRSRSVTSPGHLSRAPRQPDDHVQPGGRRRTMAPAGREAVRRSRRQHIGAPHDQFRARAPRPSSSASRRPPSSPSSASPSSPWRSRSRSPWRRSTSSNSTFPRPTWPSPRSCRPSLRCSPSSRSASSSPRWR